MAELVVDTDTLDGNRIVLAQAAADSLAQAADDGVLLAGDDLAALLGSSDDQPFVQGLDGGHVDDHGIDTGLSQLFTGLDGLVGHQTVGDDGHILAIAQDFALTNDELIALIMEHGQSQAAKAQVHGTLILVSGLDGSLGFHIIRGADDSHAGDGTHQSEVLAALVAGAVFTDADTAVGSADLHIQVGVANGVAVSLEEAAVSGYDAHQE